ncbi:SPX domain [Dillenia turbinata]|uniref:SPX domain n=1 Tax=Dillenia turbinata TaxID=194707 RepID=A0AAN8UMI6_9MAGN
MKFGKEFQTHLEETLPEWRDKYLCYKPLKKFLKNFATTATAVDSIVNRDPAQIGGSDEENNRALVELQNWFVRILSEELDKFNDFYVDKEEEFVIRLQELKNRIEQLKEKSSRGRVFTMESEFSEEMMDIRKDFVTIHGEMVLLKNYSSLNFAGLIKILKKYDKRTGGLLRLPFAQTCLHQPFFITEPLTRLVHECEANLELLFPLEAEVVESNAVQENHANAPASEAANIPPETSSSLGEETLDIYRSTLAAMRAIRGLKKASSTYNPLSFASLLGSQDAESNGAVTAENSANSSATLDNSKEADQDDAHSNKQIFSP